MDWRRIIAVGLAVLAAGVGVFYFGYQVGIQRPHNIVVEGVSNLDPENEDVDFSVFWQAWDRIRSEHIDGDTIGNLDLVYGAVQGMVGALGDPNTIFLAPEDAQKFEEDVTGRFGGIGAEIGIRDDQLVIIAPLKDSPAERAGLRPGDMILLVDTKATDGMDVNEAVKIIRGESGTIVVLNIFREGWVRPRDISITREVIIVPTLDAEIIAAADNSSGEKSAVPVNMAHLQLYSFNENAPFAFYNAVTSALTNGAQGFILDLRNNPGGFLEVAVNLAGWFVERGDVVVTQRFRSDEERVFRAAGNAALRTFPTVVLVNGGSASASEILAGALRDQLGVKLVGEQTFGKGSVQELQRLKDGSTLKITVARWVLPSGIIIEKEGLSPDVMVEISDEDIKEDRDPQLEKAITILQELIVAKHAQAEGANLKIIQL